MQADQEQRYAESDAAGQQESDLLATLLNSASVLLDRYKTQWAAAQEMFSLELKLSLKCGSLIALALMILGCVVLGSWIGLNVLVAYGMLVIQASVWSIVLTLFFLHLLILAGLLRLIVMLLDEINFKQSLSAFNNKQSATTEES